MKKIVATILVVIMMFYGIRVNAISPGNFIGMQEDGGTVIDMDNIYDSALSCLMIPCEDDGYSYWEYFTDLGDVSQVENLPQIIDAICEDALKNHYNVAFKVTDEMHFEMYVKPYEDNELIAQDEISNILVEANNQLYGLNNWNTMVLTNLDARYLDEIILAIEVDDDLVNYQIEDIKEDNKENRFSVCFKPRVYLIRRGDTLFNIAKKKLTDINMLMELNSQIEDANIIFAGSIIRIN